MEINGITGPIDTKNLGFTLMHEHIAIVDWSMRQAATNWFDKDIFVEKAVKVVKLTKECGVDTIVDLTPINLGRDIHILHDVAMKAEMQIIAATGFFYQEEIWMIDKPEEQLLKVLINDIEEGIQGTNIKAAIIKCATDSQGLTEINKKLLNITAKAHLETGIPICTHSLPDKEIGLAQQDFFEEKGVNLSNIIIGHCGDSNDVEYLERILNRGSYLGMDRFGADHVNPLGKRVATINELCKRGWANRKVLSHDAPVYYDMGKNNWEDFVNIEVENKPVDFRYIIKFAIPEFLECGITDEQIKMMTVDNPRRIFEKHK